MQVAGIDPPDPLHPAGSAALAPVVRASYGTALGRLCWLAGLIAPWFVFIHRLGFYWTTDPQYAYAWSVPILAGFLSVLRWPGQPPRDPPAAGGLLFLAAALFLPVLLIQEAAPDWSVANWCLGLAAVLLTFLYLYCTGGWRWAGWFLFPLLFLLTAVPWPQRFDLWITQSLMQRVASITVDILGWLNMPARRQGNLICLPSGSLGIDEACSGIRSIQAMLMASLFLGELCSLTAVRRAILAIAGIVLAIAGNVVRTTLLSFVVAHAGIENSHLWHDPAGFSILLFGLGGAWLLAARWRGPAEPGSDHAGASLPVLPAIIPACVIVSLLVSEAAVQYWYRLHESPAPRRHLTVSWPTDETAFHSLSIPASARRILLFSNGDAAAWRDSAGRDWSLYHLSWDPGHTSTQSARMHRPETCLEASGAVLMEDFGVHEIAVPGGSIPFHEYEFQKEANLLYVLFSLHEQRPADRDPAAMLQDWSGWSRIQRALAGQRNLGQESVEIGVTASAFDPDPLSVIAARVPSLARLETQP